MRLHIITFLLLFAFTASLHAQNSLTISGRIVDKEKKAIEFASISLSNNATKKIVGTTASADGTFLLKAAKGEYTLEVSMIGYDKYTLALNLQEDSPLGDILLAESHGRLKEVRVTANRVEYNINGYEYNVGQLQSLKKVELTEVLRSAPGIMVGDKVTLYGAPITNIYVDRRRVRMDGHDLTSYLNMFKGENIERIEVISDPDISERYGGTAIRIITKKEEAGFLSASARVMGGESKIVTNPNFNLNYRKGAFAFYTSAAYTFMRNTNEQELLSEWKDGSATKSQITTDKFKLPLSAQGTVGFSYDLSKNDYLSAEVSYSEFHRKTEREIVFENTGAAGALSGSYLSSFDAVSKKPAATLIYSHKFKDASELTLTADYVGSYNSNQYNTEDGSIGSNTENNTSAFTGYSKYSKRFKKRHSLNVGIQYSYINNEAISTDSKLVYDEKETKPFLSYSFNGNKIGLSTGLRAYLASIGGKSFNDAVPNASLSYYIDRRKGHILRTEYYMAVHRPSISQINPNAVFSDREIYIMVGNPDLDSYTSNNFSLSMNMFNKFMLSANYSRADKAISSLIYPDDKGKLYQTFVNNAKKQNVTLVFNTNLYLWNRLSVNANFTYLYSEERIEGESSRNNVLNFSLVSNLMLPKGYSVNLILYGGTKKVVSYNATQKEPLYINFQVAKTITQRWRISFNLFDILNSNRSRSTSIDMGDYIQKVSYKKSSINFQCSVAYNFRWGKMGANRRIESQKKEMTTRLGD